MKKLLCLLLSIVMIGGLLALPVSAAIFQVSYYEEAIYAGGVMDLYAFPRDGGVEPFTYQWQAQGYGWIDLVDNDVYEGTKTNHLRVHTKVGTYEGWDEIPFQCAVTDAEGTTFYTPNIYMELYPTENLIPNMKAWGYGLYTPTVSNVTGLTTDGDGNYTAYTYAGSKLDILCGSKPVEDKAVLSNSEVQLTREICITENGHTTKAGDKTTYIPYTVGANAVTVEIKLHLTIGGHDLGDLDTQKIQLDVRKPTVSSTAATKSACSLLRYTYNESQKLASIPKGATVEIVSKEGSYYQVFYNNMIGYVGTGLLNVQQPSYDPVIKQVDVTVTAPVAGEKPSFACNILTEGCQLYKTEPVTWYDKTAKAFLSATDKFIEGHSYDLTIWLAAKSGYKFQVDASNKPKMTGSINGNLPPFINKAYEQDPEEVIELTYSFNNVKAKEPEQTHTCTPVLVPLVEPTCTENGHKAYYHCACGMNYEDTQGKNMVDIGVWGKLPATGHTPSGWRTTQIVHYKACTSCGEFLEEQDHSGGTATCTELARCKVCGKAYGQLEDHRWSPTYLYKNSKGHAWICADCKTHSEVEPHSPGPAATETTPQTCKDCGYIIEPVKNHTHDLTRVPQTPATCIQEGNIEYYFCTGCNACFTDAEGKNMIPETTSVMVGARGHTVSETWKCDMEYHWRTCSVCSVVLDETRMLHAATEGKCATCGYTTGGGETTPSAPTQTPPVDSEPKPQTPPMDSTPQPQTPSSDEKQSADWAMAVMIGLACFGASVTATVIILKQKKK